jgi:hypothetical protein
VTHWRHMMDSEYLFAADLQGRDVVVTIEKITVANLIGEGGRKTKKPAAHFAGKSKPLALNATNCRVIANLLGSNDTQHWIGKAITIYPTTTKVGGETVECIRVRPELPRPATTGTGGAGNGAR